MENNYTNILNKSDIFDSVIKCDCTHKDSVIESLIEFKNNFNNIVYYTVKHFGSRVVVASISLDIIQNGVQFKVPLLVYIPKLFPYTSPIVYLHNLKAFDLTIVGKDYIDFNSFKILLKYNDKWNSKFSNLNEMLKEIISLFVIKFPIYSIGSNQKMRNILGYCNLLLDNDSDIIIFKEENKNSNNYISNEIKKSNNNLDNNKLISDEELKQSLINSISSSVTPKIKANIKEINNINNSLHLLLQKHESKNNKIKQLIQSKNQILLNSKSLISMIEKEISITVKYIEFGSNNINENIFKDIDNLFEIKEENNKKILQLITVEASIEDLLTTIKKAYLKNLINFNQSISLNRNITRELFKIQTYRKKFESNQINH